MNMLLLTKAPKNKRQKKKKIIYNEQSENGIYNLHSIYCNMKTSISTPNIMKWYISPVE